MPDPTLTFFQSLKQLKSDKHLILILALIAIPVGIASQLSWLKFRCIGEPFFGSLKATCKDNLWRMIFGGPLVFLVCYAIAAWMKSTARHLPRWQILLPFPCLLPTLFLPFIHVEATHDRVIQGIVLIFVCGFVFAARDKFTSIISRLFAKPKFRAEAKTAGANMALLLLGELTAAEKEWILDSVLRVLQEFATQKRNITVDLGGIKNFNTEFLWIIHTIRAFSLFSDSTLTLSGPDELLKIVRKDSSDNIIRFAVDGKAPHGRK